MKKEEIQKIGDTLHAMHNRLCLLSNQTSDSKTRAALDAEALQLADVLADMRLHLDAAKEPEGFTIEGMEVPFVVKLEKDLVAFYDGKSGQFVTRYYIETLQNDRDALSARGLDLCSHVPNWSVTPEGVRHLFLWLDSQ